MKNILSTLVLILCALFFTACNQQKVTKADCVGKWVCETDSTKYFILNDDGTVDFYNMCYKDLEYPEEIEIGNPDSGKNDAAMPLPDVQRQLAAFKGDPINVKQTWEYYSESQWGGQVIDIAFDINYTTETSQRLYQVHNLVDIEDGTLVYKMRMTYMWGDPDMYYNVRYKKVPVTPVTPAP